MNRPPPLPFLLCTLLTVGVMSGLYLRVTEWRLAVVTDLPQDYTSARALLNGDNAYESLFTLQPRYGLEPPPPDVMVRSNPHPPSAILFTIPFAGLSFDDALRAIQWTQLALLSLVWMTCYLMFRPPVPVWLWAVLGGLLGLWAPLRQGVAWGQPVGLLAAGTVGLWALARLERPFAFGVTLGVVTLIRPFTAIHIVQAFGWDRRQQLLAGMGLLVGGTFPFALLGITPWEWYRLAQDASGYVPWCGSLPGVFGLGAKGGQVLYAGAALVLTLLRVRGLSADATAALAATTAMLAYPLAWYYYDPSLLPVVAWVLAHVVATGNRVAAWGLVGYVALRALPNVVRPSGGASLGDLLAEHQGWIQVLARSLLLAAVVAAARARHGVSASEPS